MQAILNRLARFQGFMGTIVDMTIPVEQFALGDTFEAVPDAAFETVRVAAHGPRGVMPFLWAESRHPDRLDSALRRDDSTEAVSRLSRTENRSLYRLDWDRQFTHIINVFVDANGSLLGAKGMDDRWELRVLFPDRESVSKTYNNWRTHGIDPSIQRVNGVDDLIDYGGMDLSPCQHETLVTAFKTDYYAVPRGITLDELATELNVSHQALSERLRRGHRNIIETTLFEDREMIRHHP